MSHGTNSRSHRTTVRPTVLVDRLITAWLHWEACPTSRPAVVEIHDAIAALGLRSNTVYVAIGAQRRAGYDVPSAVERVVLDLAREAG